MRSTFNLCTAQTHYAKHTGEQLAVIDALDTGVRRGPDPEGITGASFGKQIPDA